ncbi:hypothetical protein [Acidihalobacter prosperus]
MSGRLVRLAAAALCLALPVVGAAQGGLRGELNLEGALAGNTADSLDAALGERGRSEQDARLRLMWSRTLASGWGVDVAYLAEANHGGGVTLTRSEHAADPGLYVDPRRTALLRLSHVVTDHGRYYAEHRLDRLDVSYSAQHLVLRVGRQALTWGGGLVFHPMDLFNPFAPNATYTAYKPGTDMLYAQWLFDSGADVQGVAVPRRNPHTGRVEADQSSAGIKWRGFAGSQQQFGVDLMLAKDYRDAVLGAGISGSAAGASWTVEVVPTRLHGGGVRTSLLANAQYAWILGGKNLNGYAEYFHNGFGMSGSGYTLVDLPRALSERLARGELFTVSKNYLAAGVDLQWTPLLVLKPSLIANLDDGSALLIGRAEYSLGQDTNLTAGLQFPLGGRGTEYGGLETVPGSGIYAVPAERVYARLTWYF